MALTARHAFVSAIADNPVSAAAGEILPSHWNASLSVTGTLAQADVTGLAASLAGKSNILHTHVIADTAGLQVALDGKQISGAYANAVHTHAQSDITGLAVALAGKEPTLVTGTPAQYFRGDKSLATLDKASVGLAAVDNTSDANKPLSTATVTALSGKANAVHTHAQTDITGLTVDLASKQAALVSGVTIKTVNGTSLLGAGNITIATGAAPSGLQTFGYNANGDIISVTGPSGATKTISYVNGQPTQIVKVANGVTTTTTLTYGANGVATKTVVVL